MVVAIVVNLVVVVFAGWALAPYLEPLNQESRKQ